MICDNTSTKNQACKSCYTDALVDLVEQIKYKNIPKIVIDYTKKFILDYYAALMAGYTINKNFNSAVIEFIRENGGSKESSVAFEQQKYPASEAAFMNAIYAHGADMDDGNKKAAGHIGAHVMSAVFALAEKKHSLWYHVFEAIIAGYELFNRIAGSAQPSIYQKGFHSTGVAGSIACAGACAKLLQLDHSKIYNSISLAAIQSSGLLIIDESGQSCKPINPGNAARIGVVSALLASKGVDAPRNPLESKKGWFNAFSDEIDESVLFDRIGEHYTICDSYLKLYPTCRHTHSCIDAAIELHDQIGPQLIPHIKTIIIYIYQNAIRSAGSIRYPKTPGEAKFSIYYAFAVALYKGEFGLEDLNPEMVTTNISDIIKKIHLIVDNTTEDREKNIRGCRVCIELDNKESFESFVISPNGEGNRMLTWDDLLNKVNNCAIDNMNLEDISNLYSNCLSIDPKKEYKYFL